MRVVLENGTYRLHNFGDIAMLQVAVNRLQRLFPGARIDVVTADPERLAFYCPGVSPLSVRGRDRFMGARVMMSRILRRSENKIELFPKFVEKAIAWKYRSPGETSEDVEAYVEAMREADLVLATGGGYLTDDFPYLVQGITNTLRFGGHLKKPTALLGQGLGPLERPDLVAGFQAALPFVRMVNLRESKEGPALLDRMAYPREHVTVTGDDAIELAYAEKALPGDRNGLGLCVRMGAYSGVAGDLLAQLRELLVALSNELGATLTPLPICPADGDTQTLSKLLEGTGSPYQNGGADLDSPRAVIAQAARCRVVITGAYHAGVFSLSQGIPVIGLARSTYYVHKFGGLADQFGSGCEVIDMSAPGWSERLAEAARSAWQRSEERAEPLRAAARRQIGIASEAYARLAKLN